MNSNKGFFGKLFDFSFSSFIIPQIVGVLYVLGIIAVTLFILFWAVFAAFALLARGEFVGGLVTLISAAIGWLAGIVGLRVSLESFIAMVRTAENTRILAEDVISRSPRQP